jgi:hypothetical protein
MKTPSNGSPTPLRQPSLIPQHPEQFILPLSIQEDFAARLAQLQAEGRLPSLELVREVITRTLGSTGGVQ